MEIPNWFWGLRCASRPWAKIFAAIAGTVFAFALATSMNTGMFRAAPRPGQDVTSRLQVSAEPGQDPKTPPPDQRTITVWKVSLHPSNTQSAEADGKAFAGLEASAEKIGYKLGIRSLSGEGFAETFWDAFERGQEPSILEVDNFQLIDAITAPLAAPSGTELSQKIRDSLVRVTHSLTGLEGPRRGIEFLLPTSENYAAAKRLAMRYPECSSTDELPPLPDDLRTMSETIVQAYVRGDAASLHAVEDAYRLHTYGQEPMPRSIHLILLGPPRAAGETSAIRDCGYWGNDHLVFVRMAASYETPRVLGQLPVLLIFRKSEGVWRLLAATADPVSNTVFARQIPRLASLIQNSWVPESDPTPPMLLTPDGQYPIPPTGERFGNFTWQPSSAFDAVAEIIEFVYFGQEPRLILLFKSDNIPGDREISAGQLWTTLGPWKWRVWSVSDTGALTFSQARSFIH